MNTQQVLLYKSMQEEKADNYMLYTLLPASEFSKYPLSILVDTNQSCLTYNHKPWIYIVNSYDRFNEDKLICLDLMSDLLHPILDEQNIMLNVNPIDFNKCLQYILNRRDLLIKAAYEEIDIVTFFDLLNNTHINESIYPLFEMPIIRASQTGLKFDLYIDSTSSGETSGHNGSPRLKYGLEGNPRTADWATMLLTEPYEVRNTNDTESKYIKQLRKFVKVNQQILLDLYHKKIAFEDFLKHMVKVNKSGEPIIKVSYHTVMKCQNNTEIVKSIEGWYNFIDELRHIIFYDNLGNPIKFDKVTEFTENAKGKWYATGKIDTKEYLLFMSGKMIEIEIPNE